MLLHLKSFCISAAYSSCSSILSSAMSEKSSEKPQDKQSPPAADSGTSSKRQKLTVKERFSQHERKNRGTEDETTQKGGEKGKHGKGKDKGKGKGPEKADQSLFPPGLAQLSVSFSTQSLETHQGVLPGNLMKILQICRDLTSAKGASLR